MTNAPRSVLIKMPVALKRALIAEAERTGTSVNNVAVSVVADVYNLPFVPANGTLRPADPANTAVVVRMPDAVKRAVQFDALERRSNMTDVVNALLANALGVHVAVRAPRRQTPFGGGSGRPTGLPERA